MHKPLHTKKKGKGNQHFRLCTEGYFGKPNPSVFPPPPHTLYIHEGRGWRGFYITVGEGAPSARAEIPHCVITKGTQLLVSHPYSSTGGGLCLDTEHSTCSDHGQLQTSYVFPDTQLVNEKGEFLESIISTVTYLQLPQIYHWITYQLAWSMKGRKTSSSYLHASRLGTCIYVNQIGSPK